MSSTINNAYRTAPVSVNQGGSGVSTNTTAYGLLLGGTTTTNPLQNAGTGTSNQVYLQASGSIGTWTNQNQIGAWQLITTITASNSATISFTGLTTTYYAYKVSISALIPVTDGALLRFLVSSDNGVSYDSSGGNYGYSSVQVNDFNAAALTFNNSASTTNIQIGGAIDNSAIVNNLEITLVDFPTSHLNNGPFYIGKFTDSASVPYWIMGEGTRLATQVNNAIRIQMSTGNINSGVFKLYGSLS